MAVSIFEGINRLQRKNNFPGIPREHLKKIIKALEFGVISFMLGRATFMPTVGQGGCWDEQQGVTRHQNRKAGSQELD
jgi:hypothetical protein